MAKKLISRQPQKPALKKVKKYSLAGYNLSGVSQAPQASYYLGQSAAEEANKNQNVALQSLQETESKLKEYNDQQKKQQEDIIKQSSMDLGNLALETGKNIVANRAAKKAVEKTAEQTVSKIATPNAGMAAELGLEEGANLASTGAVVGSAAPSAFMSGVSSYGQPVAAALNIAGAIIKNTGSDNNAATYTQQEQNRYTVGNIAEKTGQFAGYGSVFGPIGTLVGGAVGLGYGIYDSKKDNKKAQTQADQLASATRGQTGLANSAFIDSKMMDTYQGGNQTARYGGISKYAIGGPGDPVKGATTAPVAPQIDFSNPGATLSINGTPATYTPPPTVGPYEGMSRREAKDAYQQKVQQYNLDWAKARGVDIATADPHTLQDRIPYPQMPYSPAEQRRVDAGKEPGTMFDYYQSDRTRPGTRMLNNMNNNWSEQMGQEPIGFKEEMPAEDVETSTNNHRSSGLFERNGKPNYGGDHSTRTFKVDRAGQRRQDRDCHRGGNCGPKKYGGFEYEFGGSYNDLGGTRYVDGGKIKPIPNSNDVEYLGRTHEEGGIKLDSRTEVEDHETGTKINGTQYFFSRVLKTPEGDSYADFHKRIASDPTIDPISKKDIIKQLAKQQESAAGRDPKQIARTGGMQEYGEGGKKKKDPKKYKPNYILPDETEGAWGPKFEYARDANGQYIIDPITGQPQIIEIAAPKKLSDKEQFQKDLAEREKVVLNQKDFNGEKIITPDLTVGDEYRKTKVIGNYRNPYNSNPKYNEPPLDPKKLDLSKTWLEEHPGFVGGLAQLAGPAYAMLKPYQKTKAMATVSTVSAPQLARVNKSGEIEDARRQQNAMNTYLKNTNLGPGKIIAMQSVAAKTADEIRKISESQDRENRAIKNEEAQIAAEVAGRNQAAQLEASKSNMMADINQNQYLDERNLGVAEALGKGIAGMSMDQRKLDMQYKIARGLDKTGSLNRYEIMEQLRKQAKDPKSPVYQKSEQELQQIASELGYKVVEVLADDKEETKRFGGMARKYTSRLGDLSTKRNTTAKQSI